MRKVLLTVPIYQFEDIWTVADLKRAIANLPDNACMEVGPEYSDVHDVQFYREETKEETEARRKKEQQDKALREHAKKMARLQKLADELGFKLNNND